MQIFDEFCNKTIFSFFSLKFTSTSITIETNKIFFFLKLKLDQIATLKVGDNLY